MSTTFLMDLLAVTWKAYLVENEGPPSSGSSRVFKSSSVAGWWKKEERERLSECIDNNDDEGERERVCELKIRR